MFLLQNVKARIARPTGHQTMKPRISSTIHAGWIRIDGPRQRSWWSSYIRSAVDMALPRRVNVNNIYIPRRGPAGCQAGAEGGQITKLWAGWGRSQVRADKRELPPPAALRVS